VFAALAQDGGEGIVVDDEPENLVNYKLIVELAEKNRLPAIYPFKMFVGAGGLMSYGVDVSALGHSVADIVGQPAANVSASTGRIGSVTSVSVFSVLRDATPSRTCWRPSCTASPTRPYAADS
jgi:hypothetical protein